MLPSYVWSYSASTRPFDGRVSVGKLVWDAVKCFVFMLWYKGVLWKVDNGKHVIYLMGVGHFTATASNEPSGLVGEHFSEATLMVMEANISALDPKSLDLPSTENLFNQVDLKTQEALKAWSQTGFITPEILRSLQKKDVIATYFFLKNIAIQATAVIAQRDSITPSVYKQIKQGLDFKLSHLAMRQGKAVSYLEEPIATAKTWHEECGGIANNSRLILSVGEFMKNSAVTNEEVLALDRVLAKGDIVRFQEMRKKNLDDWLDEQLIERCVNVPRNRNWVKKIVELLEKQTKAFVVVGAAHLVGEDSVIALLRQHGMTVTLLPQH
jgi:uncharacterized protein